MPRSRSLPRDLAARDLRRAVGASIRAAREARGWTQTRLAILCDVSSVTVSRWEAGSRALTLDDLSALATAFEAAPVDLLRRAA